MNRDTARVTELASGCDHIEDHPYRYANEAPRQRPGTEEHAFHGAAPAASRDAAPVNALLTRLGDISETGASFVLINRAAL